MTTVVVMGTVYDGLDDGIREFIGAQHMFFVATAPSVGGHVNLSPKGLDTFRVVDDTTVAYLDLTGSGIETVAHLRDNGRITVLFCAFTGRPRIVRLCGTGTVAEWGSTAFDRAASAFPPHHGARAVITIKVDRVADSCGFAVPRYDYVGDRNVLVRTLERRSEAELAASREQANSRSIDGLPAL